MLSETARAKINLNLFVGRLIDEPGHVYSGYHPLSSLVAFADYGDALSCEAADKVSLMTSGPFSTGLETDPTNLVLKAYHTVAKDAALPALKFHLVKNLPVASGIGGGSADAAAALRLLRHFADLPDKYWLDIALSLGADVPVCYKSRTCIMSGIGERLEFLDGAGQLLALLVNPGVAIKTGEIFRRFDKQMENDPVKTFKPNQPEGSLRERVKASSNDLQPAAALNDAVLNCLNILEKYTSTARMSGSGATCFGIFTSAADAAKTAARIKSEFPDWWVQPAMLGDQA